jgi:hypothetical protein
MQLGVGLLHEVLPQLLYLCKAANRQIGGTVGRLVQRGALMHPRVVAGRTGELSAGAHLVRQVWQLAFIHII